MNHTVFNVSGEHIVLENLTFKNISTNAITVNGDGLNIKECVFTNNSMSGGNGSCIVCDSKGDNLIIDNCTFISNNATNGGAIYIKNTTNTSQILNCKFYYNHATGMGGAIYIDDNMYYYIYRPTYVVIVADVADDNASTVGALEMKDVIYVARNKKGDGSGVDTDASIFNKL